MRNRTNNLEVLYIPDNPPKEFPISFPDTLTHSPSAEPISTMHFHNSMEIGYCYEGCGVFFVEGKIFHFSASDISIIFKNQVHIAQSDSNNVSKWKFIFVDKKMLLSDLPLGEINNLATILSNVNTFNNILTPSLNPNICRLILALIFELDNKHLGYKSYVKSLVWQLIIEINRISNYIIDNVQYSRQNFDLIVPALEYISSNYMNNIDITFLGDLCHTSDRNLRRLFVKNLNSSPQEYLIKFRIQMACSLLKSTSSSILNISNTVGFPWISSFNRHFKKLMGVSPSAWRCNSI
ncbi:AraC family transcriptional regulator [Clostridium lacusfryxellense]|uniref:AraC family transcriptional regulator n=1 Tax=Clostridium lacusfryxellense TaxID=205328 RepID=UPI001C0D2DD1|nr:AraC family transcriptional regulator [Clostridium lacusfryxellense]MBU3113289.1 AraC family transcriptional regulator [Clostridium lacusfryxellense]